jgi:hypothetical protein
MSPPGGSMQVRTEEMAKDFDLAVGDDGEVLAVVIRAGMLPRERVYELAEMLDRVLARMVAAEEEEA